MDQPVKDLTIKVDNLTTFLQKNMVTKRELEDLKVELPSRAEFNQLQISVDGIAKQFKDRNEERVVGAERSTRMESWIMNASKKIGIDYKP